MILTLAVLSFSAALTPVLVQAGVSPSHAPSTLQGADTPQCSIEVPNGSSIIDQYTVRFPDGVIHTFSQQDCTPYSLALLPTINGWIEDAEQRVPFGTFSMVFGDWTVPNAPSNQNDPLIYFFNGIQKDTSQWIVQPVLAWGCAGFWFFGWCSLGGHHWWIAAWAVYGGGGPSYHSSPISVSPGHHITGSVDYITSSASCANGGSGAHYFIVISDITIGTGNSLNFCTSVKAERGLAGVFEAKRVNNCNQLPNQQWLTFYNIGSNPTVTWGWQVYGVTPSCNYSVSIDSGTQVTLNWRPW